MTVDVSCSHVSRISSVVLLGDEFKGFVKFKKPFHDFNQLITDIWCFVCAACLDLSVRLATVRLMSCEVMPASRCRLSMLVGFRLPVVVAAAVM